MAVRNELGEQIKEQVRSAYGQVARRFVDAPAATGCGCGPAQGSSCCGSEAELECECGAVDQAGCCGATDEASCCCGASQEGPSRAERHGYSLEELSDLPESVTEASLGCGNPTAIAGLQPGEVVLDLGSGGGIDCFLAAKRVGPNGQAIGLDMTTDMIRLARRNAKKLGVNNVDFRYGEMEEMPFPDAYVDVVISNCVINLSPDKDAVFGEIARVLKPGGRVSVSDIVTNGPLPEVLRDHSRSWAACVAGALDESEYLDKMRAAGLTDVTVTDRVYASVEGLLDSPDVQALIAQSDEPLTVQQLDQLIASVTVTAHKP